MRLLKLSPKPLLSVAIFLQSFESRSTSIYFKTKLFIIIDLSIKSCPILSYHFSVQSRDSTCLIIASLSNSNLSSAMTMLLGTQIGLVLYALPDSCQQAPQTWIRRNSRDFSS
jgi:hypothetical protein